ncbi:transmembrane amino acid transporter protein-domain-containing protein [Phaeosphaeria sp. MPI-PUGE-AT-0046c]|nr:transmembrane amino acid transporter protein-domain-containing protein [Phaeosphaeria sp. MPI-PUGE-AT-0046c]
MASHDVSNEKASTSFIPDAKTAHQVATSDSAVSDIAAGETDEVFQTPADGVNFRTVSWQRATIVFIKIEVAMSILAIPEAMAVLGAVGGAISVIAWTALNTYTAVLVGEARSRRHNCHTLADLMGTLWGRWGRDLITVQLVIAQILVCAGGIVSTSAAFNAVSNHGACTVIFALVSAISITMCSSVRTFARLGWLTWVGFGTFFLAIFIFTVAVTQTERPAAAPKGDFELGFAAIRYPTFIAGMVMSANIFVSTSGSSMYVPVIAEMRRPQDYRKAAIIAGIVVGTIYLVFPLVTYRYCGNWLSSPAFGSAGPMWSKISYGIALPGLIIGVGIYQHVTAKYLFVRLMRNSRHFQINSFVHWATWIGINVALGSAAFLISQAVPILNFLLALAAALGFAPFSLIYPTVLWAHDHKLKRSGTIRQRSWYWLNALIGILSAYLVVTIVYGVGVSIRDAFSSGLILKTFDCRDNSGITAPQN